MLKAKMTLSGLSIPRDKITNIREDDTMKTIFQLRAKLNVSKRKAGSLSGEDIGFLNLQWIETVDWFEYINNEWILTRTEPNNRDMYASKSNSNTFKRTWPSYCCCQAEDENLGNVPPAELKAALAKGGEEAAKHWIAKNGFEWTTVVAIDEPALDLRPRAGSGGGAGPSSVTTLTRRRVVYFDLGFKDCVPRVTATQVLESVNGRPTLLKFLVPGWTRAQVNDEANLERWREELRTGILDNFTS